MSKSVESQAGSSHVESAETKTESSETNHQPETLETGLVKYEGGIQSAHGRLRDSKEGANKDIKAIDTTANLSPEESAKLANIEHMAGEERDKALQALQELRAEDEKTGEKGDKTEVVEKAAVDGGLAEKQDSTLLQPGDEIFYNGLFYKIDGIKTNTLEDKAKKWEEDKDKRDREFAEISKLLPFKEGSLYEARQKYDKEKRAELEQLMGKRKITALLKGSDSSSIELSEENVIKVKTPEQREKIVKMQKEQDDAEKRVARFMGMSGTKKMVDIATGQPGKF